MILGFSSLTPKDVFFSFLSLFLEGKKTARPVLGRHQVVSILEHTEKIIMTLAKRRMLSSRMALEQQQEQWQEELNKQYG